LIKKKPKHKTFKLDVKKWDECQLDFKKNKFSSRDYVLANRDYELANEKEKFKRYENQFINPKSLAHDAGMCFTGNEVVIFSPLRDLIL
jgi:hypothetical protein